MKTLVYIPAPNDPHGMLNEWPGCGAVLGRKHPFDGWDVLGRLNGGSAEALILVHEGLVRESCIDFLARRLNAQGPPYHMLPVKGGLYKVRDVEFILDDVVHRFGGTVDRG